MRSSVTKDLVATVASDASLILTALVLMSDFTLYLEYSCNKYSNLIGQLEVPYFT